MAFGIAHLTSRVEALAEQVQILSGQSANIVRMLASLTTTTGRLEQTAERIESNMPTDADIQAALGTFATVVTQAVTDAQNRTAADIAALKAQIANGQPVSQADLDAIMSTQSQVLAGIAAIDPANPTPPPTP